VNGRVIGDKLKRNRGENASQQGVRARDAHHFIGNCRNLFVPFTRDRNNEAFARTNLFDIGGRLRVQFIAGDDGDNRQSGLNQRDGPVFHFARRIAFRVDVRNFLELERPFESNWKTDSASEIESTRRGM
jgi:hypothetical protein